LRTRGLHTTVYNKEIKLAKPPRRSPLTDTDERVTYNCVQQGNKVGQTTAPKPAHSYGREGYIQLYNKGIKLAKPPRQSPLTVTDERVTYNCVHQGISWPNHRRSPLTSYGREGYIQLCTTRE
ncbi:hypothetical protein J6590_095284, partial [Homalodisca vitripennis]